MFYIIPSYSFLTYINKIHEIVLLTIWGWGSEALGESFIEYDPTIVELAVKQKDVKKVHGDVTGNVSEEEIPKKRKKKQSDKLVINPEKSWFEINVIDKNIRERKEMEERIGLTRIVQELRNSADHANVDKDRIIRIPVRKFCL